MENTWSKEELAKLKENLPPKWKELLAAEFEISEKRVANILAGDRVNSTVILKAIKLAEAHKKEVTAAREALAAL